MGDRAPVPDQEVTVLRALFVGVCAFVFLTHAAAAAKRDHPTEESKPTRVQAQLAPEKQLQRQLVIVHKERGVVRFFQTHRSLLSSPRRARHARASLRRASRRLVAAQRSVAYLRRTIALREEHRLEKLPPKAAICDAFDDYCRQAVEVAWCESRLRTTAQNGQYLGLFQMGTYARQLFGHGPTAHEQAIAAHKYFVSSGSDWSPWSCKPWTAS